MLGDELDIYDDLDEFQEVEDKKSKELLALEEKYTAAQGEIEGLRAQNNKLTKQIKQMEVNLQNLLDTAKAEIKRKETLIADLRKEKDDICFRRKKPWGVEDTKPNQKRPRHDKPDILENPGPMHKRAKQEETEKNTSGLVNTVRERIFENPFAVQSQNADKTAIHKSQSPSPGLSRKPSTQHRSSNVVQEKPVKEGNQPTQKTVSHKSRSPSPGHSRKASTQHRSTDSMQEKSIAEPAKVSNQPVDKAAKHESRSPPPGHSRNPSTQHGSSTVVQGKTMEKPVKGSNQQADKTVKHKSRSPSPGHSRKSSTHHRFTDSRTRERERQKERDRERERERRHDREIRRSRSPKRSNQDEHHRKRVSNDKSNQCRRQSGSRSRQRTASSGTRDSREQSSNKVKSDTIKTLFGEETNDHDANSNANTEGIMQNESTTHVKTLIQPVENTLPAEINKSQKTKAELKEINEPLVKTTSLVTSKESKINENHLKQSDTGKSTQNLDTKPLKETAIPGLDLLTTEDNDKEVNSKQQNESKSVQSIFSMIKIPEIPPAETITMPQIPGLDLLTCANSKAEPNKSTPDENIALEMIEKPEISGLNSLTSENNEKDLKLNHKTVSKCRDNGIPDHEAPIKELESHKQDDRKVRHVEDSAASFNDPDNMENVKTTDGNTEADKSQKCKEQTHKEVATKTEKKEDVLPKIELSKEDAVDDRKRDEKDQNVTEIVGTPDRKESLITPEVKVFKEDAVDKKDKGIDQPSKELINEIEAKKSLIRPEVKIQTDTTGDDENQKESLITPELKVTKDNYQKGKKSKRISVETEGKDAVSTESIAEQKPIENERALSESSKTFSQTLDEKAKSEIIQVTANSDSVDMKLITKTNENKLQSAPKGKQVSTESQGQKFFHAGLITPRRKTLKADSEFPDDDVPTPKRPTPVKESKHITPPRKSKDNNPEVEVPAKPLNRAIQIIEDIRLPVMMDIEHIAVRVDGVDENVDIPLPPASVKVLPMTKPSTIMYAQPDSTKIDHNENDMVLEAALNVLTAIEEGKDPYPPDSDIVEPQLGDISFEFDTLESALEQLHQTSPDESIVTSTSTKANQQPTAKQDLIKILSRSPNHESPIKLPAKVERATEKTPLKKRKINMRNISPIRPRTEPSATQEKDDEQHVTIDETLNLSDNANSDSSIVTKRCSLGQSDYQFERINDEVILRVTRRPRRRRPPPANTVEITQN